MDCMRVLSDVLNARIGLTNNVLSIVTGANPYANLVDMISLVTVNRLNVENYWMPLRFGDSALLCNNWPNCWKPSAGQQAPNGWMTFPHGLIRLTGRLKPLAKRWWIMPSTNCCCCLDLLLPQCF